MTPTRIRCSLSRQTNSAKVISELPRLTLGRGKLIDIFYKAEPFPTPAAILMASGNAAELVKDHRAIVTRFAATTIEVPVKRGNAGKPRTTTALLLQLGPHDNAIHFSDPTVTHALATDNNLTKTIVALRKSTMPNNLFDKLAGQPKAFHD